MVVDDSIADEHSEDEHSEDEPAAAWAAPEKLASGSATAHPAV